jgi:AraC-like DNA-binding protein
VNADLVPVPSQMLERLAAVGVDVAGVLQHARLSRSQLAARARLTTREFFAFWRAVEQAAGTRYKRLVCPEEIAIEIADGEARIRFHWILAEEQVPLLILDGAFATVVAIARRGTGRPIAPRRVELTRRRANEATLARHFGCEIHFDAPLDRLVLEERALAEPFVTHNEDLLAVMLPGLEAAVNERGAAPTVADDVRMILGRCMDGERPTVEKIAQEMRMSPRTLQRRLEDAGTTYQELLDDVRRQSARRLLANTDLDAGEVAFLLGFEELNSFTRAFHAWEGTTPTRWRAS